MYIHVYMHVIQHMYKCITSSTTVMEKVQIFDEKAMFFLPLVLLPGIAFNNRNALQ